MKSLFSFLFFLAIFQIASGQDFFAYDHPVAIDTLFVGNAEYERAAQRYAQIGEYKWGLELYDRDFADQKDWERRHRMPKEISTEELEYFNAFQATDATQYLAEKARRRQIVMFNEAHHSPLHRAYVHSLLDDFYQAGYRYLALEALSQYDTLLNERGYPTLKSGYFLREPQMANLVRGALAMGYTVVPYEKTEKGLERDHQQALNLKKVLEEDPEARMLVLCGFFHLTETPVDPKTNGGKERYMAGWFKEETGIDPFTINQVVLSERSSEAQAAPYYPLINQNGPTILQNKDGDLFNGPKGTEFYDVLLYHPPTSYVSNRPRWMLWNEKAQLYQPDLSSVNIDYPIMVRAYLQAELTESLLSPVDIIMLDAPEDETALVLQPGKYVLVAENAYGDSQQLEVMVGKQ